jgi:hypothetical protein
MFYDPTCDFYAILGIVAEATPDEVRQAVAWQRRTGRNPSAVERAASVLLDRTARVLYDVKRASYRVKQLVLFDELGGV